MLFPSDNFSAMELSVENSGGEESALLQLVTVLGDTLAGLQATIAREEFGLQQIVASIKFVNHTIDAWVNSSQQEVSESSEVHVYESDFSEVSKSIDAILDEARMARGSPEPSASPKEPLSTPRLTNIAETPRKSKAADHKKTLERFSQALRIRPRKAVSPTEDSEHSSFSAAQEMLLKWMENKKDGWVSTHAEQQHLNSSKSCSEECFPEESNAARNFLDSLWKIHSIPPDSLTVEDDDNAGADLNDVGHENDDSNTTGAENEVQTMTQRVQKNVELLQAHCKLFNEGHQNENLLHSVGEDFPFMISSLEEKQCQQHIGIHNEESVANYDCWLPAIVCRKVLEMEQVKGIILEHETQPVPIFYSHLEQALEMTQLMHSIHSNLFHCYLQSLLAQTFLKSSAQLSRRVDDILCGSSMYFCFRLAHCLVCKNGKSLLSIARRIDIS